MPRSSPLDRSVPPPVVSERRGGHLDVGGVVEGDQAEVVDGIEPVDQGQQRSLRSRESAALVHGAAAVQHHL
jgi:hypothetical protein